MTDFFAPAVAAPRAPAPAPAPARRRRLLPVAAGLALVAVVGAGWWWSARSPELQLPDRLGGLPRAAAETDIGTDEDWLQSQAELHGGEVAGRSYSAGPGTRPLLLNAVVAAADSTGKGDVGLAGGTTQQVGEVSCTQTLDLSLTGTPATAYEDQVLCWRTSRELSVSVFVLGTDPSFVPTAAAAVQQVWDLQG